MKEIGQHLDLIFKELSSAIYYLDVIETSPAIALINCSMKRIKEIKSLLKEEGFLDEDHIKAYPLPIPFAQNNTETLSGSEIGRFEDFWRVNKDEKIANIIAFLSIMFGENPERFKKTIEFNPNYVIEKFERYVESLSQNGDRDYIQLSKLKNSIVMQENGY